VYDPRYDGLVPEDSKLFFDSVWLRPARSRSGQPTLSREQIVRAAIELLDAEGPAGLSMRRLGSHLGAGATSLYWHVGNKDELLELAIDEVMGEIYVPEAGDTGWRTGLSMLANGMRAALLRHPWVVGLLGSKPTIGPNAMRVGERTVILLTSAGFHGLELGHVSAAVHAHAIGSATTQSAVAAAVKRAGVPAIELVERMEPFLEAVAPDHPHYDRWRRENLFTEVDPEAMWEQSFAFGLERLLDGLELWLDQRKSAGTPGTVT
jgi:AcrR family transcriptional regulator